jgi:hypothetical protein
MQQVTYANGKLWGALDTALTINGADRAGIAWYVVNPNAAAWSSKASLAWRTTI